MNKSYHYLGCNSWHKCTQQSYKNAKENTTVPRDMKLCINIKRKILHFIKGKESPMTNTKCVDGSYKLSTECSYRVYYITMTHQCLPMYIYSTGHCYVVSLFWCSWLHKFITTFVHRCNDSVHLNYRTCWIKLWFLLRYIFFTISSKWTNN